MGLTLGTLLDKNEWVDVPRIWIHCICLHLLTSQFHSLAPMYYRNAAAAVVVYDITKAVRCLISTSRRPALIPGIP